MLGLVAKVAALAAAFAAGVALLGARSAEPGLTGGDGRPLRRTATVDGATGQILLPVDGLVPTLDQTHRIEYAVDLLLADCVSRSNERYEVVDRRRDALPVSRRYGLWAASDVETHGYAAPPSTPLARRQERLNRTGRPAAVQRLVAPCLKSPELRALALNDLGTQYAAADVHDKTMASPEAAALIGEWRACLRAHGVPDRPGKDGPLTPAGVTAERTPENLRVARVDVRCKTETDLVRRLATMEAAGQWELITAHPDSARGQAARLRGVLARVDEVIRRLGTP